MILERNYTKVGQILWPRREKGVDKNDNAKEDGVGDLWMNAVRKYINEADLGRKSITETSFKEIKEKITKCDSKVEKGSK